MAGQVACSLLNTREPMLRLTLLSIALLAGGTSWAESNDNAKSCVGEAEHNNLDLAIDYCTRAIQSGQLSGEDLAITFNNRGLAHHDKKDYDRAIHDYDQAIGLGLNNADLFYHRGLVYFEKNDFNHAIQDFDQSLKLDPDNLVVLQRRGWAYENNKDYDQAIRDYDRAISLQPNYGPVLIRRANVFQEKRQYEQALADYEAAAQVDPQFASDRSKGFLLFYLGRMTQSAEMFEKYIKAQPDDIWVILFRYLAEAKIGNALAAARELERDAANLKERRWPRPIIDFHIGRIDEKAMFAAANDPDPKTRNEKICAANFHAGEARLFRAHITAAIDLLRAAEKDCPPHLYQSHGASTELKRLGLKR
jgi:tetratricopeptide (TPR) repeat protein